MKSSFFVIILTAILLSGCSVSFQRDPGIVAASGPMGTNVTAGFTDVSDILVRNPYPDLSMEVKLQVISYPAWAWRGDGNDPLLGTPPKPWRTDLTHVKATPVEGKSLIVCPNRIVLEREYVAVLVSWYDGNGRYRGRGSIVFLPGNTWRPWHYDCTPVMDSFGTALRSDVISTW